jgi:hypothetical protein
VRALTGRSADKEKTLMSILPITITGGCAHPNPGRMSHNGHGGEPTEVRFQCGAGTFHLTGLDVFLQAPKFVTITPGTPAGPYLLQPDAAGGYSYIVDPVCPSADDPVIVVDASF